MCAQPCAPWERECARVWAPWRTSHNKERGLAPRRPFIPFSSGVIPIDSYWTATHEPLEGKLCDLWRVARTRHTPFQALAICSTNITTASNSQKQFVPLLSGLNDLADSVSTSTTYFNYLIRNTDRLVLQGYALAGWSIGNMRTVEACNVKKWPYGHCVYLYVRVCAQKWMDGRRGNRHIDSIT